MEYDKVNYEKEVESAITNLLNYPLIAFNILEINDTTLQSLINDRMSFKHTLDSNFRDLFDFCTYFTVQDIIERESPYGNLYKTIVLNNQRGSSIDIGFSAFKYPPSISGYNRRA